MGSKPTVYLAGKVKGGKWNFSTSLMNSKDFNFCASDDSNQEDHCRSVEVFGYEKDEVREMCNDQILSSDILIAYIDSCDAYGTIAEIAYASANGINCYVFLEYGNTKGEFGDKNYPDNYDYFDPYWLVSNFPHVYFSDKEEIELQLDILTKRRKLESPIEKMFFEEIIRRDYKFIRKLEPQFHIGGYRVDFAIPSEKIVLELDGHGSHSSKEQRTNDSKRQRILTAEGWKVIRFTGSEIYQDVNSCLKEVYNMMGVELKEKLKKWF